MKKYCILLTLLIIVSIVHIYGQKIYQVMYEDQCDVKIFLSENEENCDLKVFFVDEEEKSSKPGCWFVCDFPDKAETKIYFTEHETNADVKVFIVGEEASAGWKNEEKKDKIPVKK